MKGYDELLNLLEKHRRELSMMEDAYIASRYLVREYSREEAELLVTFAEEVLKHGEVR